MHFLHYVYILLFLKLRRKCLQKPKTSALKVGRRMRLSCMAAGNQVLCLITQFESHMLEKLYQFNFSELLGY